MKLTYVAVATLLLLPVVASACDDLVPIEDAETQQKTVSSVCEELGYLKPDPCPHGSIETWDGERVCLEPDTSYVVLSDITESPEPKFEYHNGLLYIGGVVFRPYEVTSVNAHNGVTYVVLRGGV